MSSNDNAPGSVPDWHALGAEVRRDTRLAPGSAGIQDVYQVPYVIDSGPAKGARHEVAVSEEEFTPEAVRQAIEEHATAVHGIAQLGRGDAGLA